jgi:hypothetical protein
MDFGASPSIYEKIKNQRVEVLFMQLYYGFIFLCKPTNFFDSDAVCLSWGGNWIF